MKLIYINSGASSVFDSQVLTLLKYYKNENIFDDVILLFGYYSVSDIQWLKTKDTRGIVIYFYKNYPNYPMFNRLNKKSISSSLKKISFEFSDCFFHLRGELPSYYLKKTLKDLKISSQNILTDVRGVRIEEINEFSKMNKISKLLKLKNYKDALRSLKYDKSISVVSKSLKNHLISSVELSKELIYVTPCLVSKEFRFDLALRNTIRKKLNIDKNEIVLVFATGGSAAWQNHNIIKRIADKGFKILNLSRLEIKHKNIITRFVDYSEMSGYLSASDVAFIWRNESLVNKVASPVKVSEYICCGLPVIHNGTIDMIKDITNYKRNTMYVEKAEDLSLLNVKQLIQKVNRLELSEIGKIKFGIKNIAESYNKIYFKALRRY